jgi:DNA-binding response OmpR family regulator
MFTKREAGTLNQPPPKSEQELPAKILIVDDEPSNRWMLAAFLRERGYEPLEAQDATSALSMFVQHQPPVVLLDISLPDGSGLEVLRSLKQSRPETIVIMVTADLVIENTIAALRGGADDFIGKPLHLDELNFALTRSLQAQQKSAASHPHRLPHVLLISDDTEQLKQLQAAFARLDVTTNSLALTNEPEEAPPLENPFDLVVVDVGPEILEPLLKQIRESAAQPEIPVLVAANRVQTTPNLAGVLPRYRAMPCSPSELLRLAERRLTSITRQLPIKKEEP